MPEERLAVSLCFLAPLFSPSSSLLSFLLLVAEPSPSLTFFYLVNFVLIVLTVFNFFNVVIESFLSLVYLESFPINRRIFTARHDFWTALTKLLKSFTMYQNKNTLSFSDFERHHINISFSMERINVQIRDIFYMLDEKYHQTNPT